MRAMRRLLHRAVPLPTADFDAGLITGLADAAAVTSWTDGTVRGHTVSQGTEGNQPTYQTNELNGFPCVRFATDDYLSVGAPLQATTSYTMLAVWKIPPTSALMDGMANGNTGGYSMGVSAANARIIGHKSVGNLTGGAATSNYEVWCATRTGATSFWINGANVLNNSASTPNTPNTSFTLGASSGGANPATVDIVRALLFPRGMGIPQRKFWERRVGRKYGLTVG